MTAPPGGDRPWADPAWVAATLGRAVGAAVGDDRVEGVVELVVPPTAGRPRRPARGRAAAPAAGPAADEPAEVRAHLVVVGGRVAAAGPGGPDGEPALTLTLGGPDVADLLAGTEPSVLFMQGRLKVDGDLATALALLRASASPGLRAALRAAVGA
ncbi:MAG TPA: SCP2 sterol-binding domain-containing protein [Acidimicrobiales bacterium]|nr:SCP2 sterol-binding domain-containing protein [Acidimicrobiales bacterium]